MKNLLFKALFRIVFFSCFVCNLCYVNGFFENEKKMSWNDIANQNEAAVKNYLVSHGCQEFISEKNVSRTRLSYT